MDVVAVVITGCICPLLIESVFLVRRWKFNFGTEINMDREEEEEKARAHTILSLAPARHSIRGPPSAGERDFGGLQLIEVDTDTDFFLK